MQQNHRIFTVGKDLKDHQVQHLKPFYLPEETSGTHSPTCKLKLSQSAHSSLLSGFSLSLLSIFFPNENYRITHATSDNISQAVYRHQHLAKRTGNSPKALPPFAFSTAVSHHNSVSWQLSCTVAPSPPGLLSHDLLMVDLFLLLTSSGVYCEISNLHSPCTQLFLCNCPIPLLSHANDNRSPCHQYS